MKYILSVLKLLAFVLGTLILVCIHLVWYLLTRRLDVTMWFHKMCCFIFNIKIKVYGQSARRESVPIIYMANHISYLDILVLGSMLDGCFVAKSEVANWPGFGFLSKLQKTIFIVRDKSALKKSRESIAQAIQEGHDIILFPEGTSTDGLKVEQFKAGLLGILLPDDKSDNPTAMIENALVQPVAIRHDATDGVMPSEERRDIVDLYAWYADMELVPHLWALGQTKRTDVSVHFIDPLAPSDFVHRFDIANAAQERVARIVERKD